MLKMHTMAVQALAKLTRIDIQTATQTVRENPILETEIHIDEELINLKESMDSYRQAAPTLRRYPNIRLHVARERRQILQHCIGLTERMLRGRKLPYSYTRSDIDYAVRRMVQLIVEDCRITGRPLDTDIITVFKPFMSLRQRVMLREWGIDMFSTRVGMQRQRIADVYNSRIRKPRLQQ